MFKFKTVNPLDSSDYSDYLGKTGAEVIKSLEQGFNSLSLQK